MKTKLVSATGAVMLAMFILLTAHQAVAATPTGELKIVEEQLGHQVPIPRLEITQANDWMQLLYDNLVGAGPGGELATDNGLAQKWEMSRDGLTWTFHLRKGVKFHNGVEVTSKDVKFSLEQLAQPDSLSTLAGNIAGAVKSIEVKDPYTVIVHCKKPSLFFPTLLSKLESTDGMIIPKDYYEKVGKDEFQRKPIGSGPYKWHSQVVGSFIKLEATDKHWYCGVPRYKYVTFLIVPEDSTRVAMLKTGEADITRISRDSVKEVKGAGLNVIVKPSITTLTLHCNMQWTNPAFSDIKFRKALNFAIDREAIMKHLFAGLATPIAGYPGKGVYNFNAPKLKPYPYDLKMAKQLIKEGGYEGLEFTVVSYPRAGCPEFPTMIETVAGYWKEIGLKPTILMSDYPTWREKWMNRQTQNTIHGYPEAVGADIGTMATKLREKWYSKSGRTVANMPELDKKFEKLENTMELGEVKKILADIYRYGYDQHIFIPLCNLEDQIATVKRVPKWDPGVRRGDKNLQDLIRQK